MVCNVSSPHCIFDETLALKWNKKQELAYFFLGWFQWKEIPRFEPVNWFGGISAFSIMNFFETCHGQCGYPQGSPQRVSKIWDDFHFHDFMGSPLWIFSIGYPKISIKKPKGGTPWNHENENCPRSLIFTVVNPTGTHSIHAKFQKKLLLERLKCPHLWLPALI